jgi:hypothetical protein
MKRLRDAPTSNGYPNSVNWSKALSSCRLCVNCFSKSDSRVDGDPFAGDIG